MAYQYDQLGNVVGEYESEEERRRRELAEQPVKQTITYNADGSQEMTIKGTPEALSSANPNTPTVSGPVAPDQVYNNMLQVESGNRDFDSQGRPVTSSAGAMFAGQVMPATARQPGYGIRPAASQTPEEYNRVGQEYFQAMRKQFPGNEQAAIAAYNAGPGRVQQNMRANQGQMNVAQLPRETQGYLQKVGNMVSNMIPSAQAGTLPPQAQQARPSQAPAQQTQPIPDSVINDQVAAYEARQPGGQYSLATGQSGLGLQAPQAAAPAQPAIDTGLFDFYQRNQDNPQALISMGFSDAPGMPDFLKDRMKNRAAELIQQQREEAQAKKEIPNMSESDIARALREKTTGGSYIKAVLFGMLGMENSAQAEAAKLGIGKETFTTINGQPALVKLAANGTPIEGYNAATGMKLSSEELVTAAQYGTAQKGAQTHTGKMQDMTTGEVFYERTTPQGIELVDNNGKKYKGPSANLRPFGIGSDIQTRNQIQINELQNKLAYAGPTERAKIVAENEAKFGPLDPNVRAQALGQVTGTVPTQTTQAPLSQAQQALAAQQRPPVTEAPAAGAPATQVPAAQPGAPAAPGQTIAGRESAQQTGIKRTESFNKILDEEVRPDGQKGDTISARRKQQFEIFDRPGVDMNKIFGIATGAGRSASDQTWTIVRDVLLGKFEGRTDDIKQRAAALGLSPAEQSALAEYHIANVDVNAANLKKSAGAGSVSDAEQKVNREAGVDPTKIPALGAYNAMSQSKFDADKARWKADWASTSTATNALELDKQWRQESNRLTKIYSDIAKERARFIADNGSTTAAVKEGYKRFPIPDYVPGEGWKKTRPLSSFNR